MATRYRFGCSGSCIDAFAFRCPSQVRICPLSARAMSVLVLANQFWVMWRGGECFRLTGMVVLGRKIGWRVLEKVSLNCDGDGLRACGGVQLGEYRVDMHAHPARL